MRSHARPGLFLFLLLFLLPLGCFRDPDPIQIDDDGLAIHAVLETGADSAVVLLNRPGDGGFGSVRGVSGGDVRVVLGSDTIWLVEDVDRGCTTWAFGPGPTGGSGCYRGRLPRPIPAERPVTLEVVLPDGTAARGETVPPAGVAVRRPDPGLHVDVPCPSETECVHRSLPGPTYEFRPLVDLPVAWRRPRGVEAVSVRARPTAVFHEGVRYPGSACILGYDSRPTAIAGDSTRWVLAGISCGGSEYEELRSARFDSIHAELVVTGWNAEYTRWIDVQAGEGIRVDHASAGIEGAWGVFGAVSTATRAIVLVRAR